MWANMCIFKVGVTRSLRTCQNAELLYNVYLLRMLKVDLCANGAGAYASHAPPLPTGLVTDKTEWGVYFAHGPI